jgi:hypothetical protein
VALLTARFAVRRAELDASANELIAAIEAQKNVLSLDEAKRALEQIEHDTKSRAETNSARWRWSWRNAPRPGSPWSVRSR